jgi:hypothetical protein
MRPSQRNFCLTVLDTIMARPYSAAFLGPPGGIEAELRRFPRPVYLPQVKAMLLGNEYASIRD